MPEAKARARRILHIISSGTVGGAEKCFLEMLEAARDLNYETAAVCTGGGLLEKAARGVCDRVYTASMADNADLFSLYKLYRIIKEYKPDLCHLHMNRATLLGAVAARFAGVKSLGSIQGEVRPLYARFPDYLTFCSINTAEHVRSRSLAVAKKPSFYLYNGIDCDRLKAEAETGGGRSFIKNEFGLPENAFVVCQVARMHKNKGHKFLIDSIGDNIGRIPGLYCLMVGGGDEKYEELLRIQAKKLEISDRIIFCGTRLDVAKILSGADLFVLPSLQEGIPVTIMEALCLKVPVAAFGVGGIYELCRDGEKTEPYVELIASEDRKALTDKIYDIYANYGLYKSNAERASEFIVRRFGKDSYIRDIKAIYKNILGP